MKASLFVFAVIAAMGVLSNNVALAQEAEVTTTSSTELTYRVHSGDTLEGLARYFSLDPREIIDANISLGGVIIDHCGDRPRRIWAGETIREECAWLLEGADIIIPPRREPVIEAADPQSPTSDTGAMETENVPEEELIWLPPEGEFYNGLKTISAEWPQFKRSQYSLHAKVDHQSQIDDRQNQLLGQIIFEFRLGIGIILLLGFFILLSLHRRRKREREIEGEISEAKRSILGGIDIGQLDRIEAMLMASSAPPSRRPSPPEQFPSPIPKPMTAAAPPPAYHPNCVGDGEAVSATAPTPPIDFGATLNTPLSPEDFEDSGSPLIGPPTETRRPAITPTVAPPGKKADWSDADIAQVVSALNTPEEKEGEKGVSKNTQPQETCWLGSAMGRLAGGKFPSPSEVPDGPPPDDPSKK